MESNNFTAPQGQMQSSFTAPESNGGKEKRSDIQLLPPGPNSGVIFCVVDLGTHMESFGNQEPKKTRKIKIGYEHPQLKQLFYEEDTEIRSSSTWTEGTYAVNEKSNLRKLIEAVLGKKISDQEAYNFDLSKLIGSKVLVNISHVQGKKDPSRSYEKVLGVMHHGQMPLPANFNPMSDQQLFSIDKNGDNFTTQNFATLLPFLKKKIMASEEAIAHARRGGKFAHIDNSASATNAQQTNNYNNQQQSQPQNSGQNNGQNFPPQQGNGIRKFVLTDNSYTLESWKSAGWNEESLVQNGKGHFVEPTPPSAPQGPPSPQNLPQGPPSPQGPPQMQQQQSNNVAQPNQNSGFQSNSGFNSNSNEEDDDMPF
jgi:hypothetical protein